MIISVKKIMSSIKNLCEKKTLGRKLDVFPRKQVAEEHVEDYHWLCFLNNWERKKLDAL